MATRPGENRRNWIMVGVDMAKVAAIKSFLDIIIVTFAVGVAALGGGLTLSLVFQCIGFWTNHSDAG